MPKVKKVLGRAVLGNRLWKPFIIPVLVLGSFLDSYNPFGGQEGFENDPEPKGSVQS